MRMWLHILVFFSLQFIQAKREQHILFHWIFLVHFAWQPSQIVTMRRVYDFDPHMPLCVSLLFSRAQHKTSLSSCSSSGGIPPQRETVKIAKGLKKKRFCDRGLTSPNTLRMSLYIHFSFRQAKKTTNHQHLLPSACSTLFLPGNQYLPKIAKCSVMQNVYLKTLQIVQIYVQIKPYFRQQSAFLTVVVIIILAWKWVPIKIYFATLSTYLYPSLLPIQQIQRV